MDDIDLLPDDLRQRSFSDKEIVFPYQEALLAFDHIVDAKWGLLGWEGWVKRDQGLGHHQDYQGTVNLSPDQEQSWEELSSRSIY